MRSTSKAPLALLAAVAVAGVAVFLTLRPARKPEGPRNDQPAAMDQTEPASGSVGALQAPSRNADAPASPPATAKDPRIDGLRSEADVQAYLGALESEAKAKGRVTDQIVNASQALRKAEPMLGKERAAGMMSEFGHRMTRLAKYLEIKPVEDELDGLAQQIQGQKDPQAKEKLVAAYRSKSARLPGIYRLEASDRLKRLVEPTP